MMEAAHFTYDLVDNVYAPPPGPKQDPYDELLEHFISVNDQIDNPYPDDVSSATCQL